MATSNETLQEFLRFSRSWRHIPVCFRSLSGVHSRMLTFPNASRERNCKTLSKWRVCDYKSTFVRLVWCCSVTEDWLKQANDNRLHFFTNVKRKYRWNHNYFVTDGQKMLYWTGAQIKNQKETEPEFNWKCRPGAGVTAIWEVAPALSPFLDSNGFAK